jgi:hypothetical protein
MKKENSNNNLVYVLLLLLFISLLTIFSLVKDRGKQPIIDDGNTIVDDGGIIRGGKGNTNTCGITNCHGMDITCGNNTNMACTMMYQIGDNCRQFATCETTKAGCAPVYSAEFTQCKTCVQDCINRFKDESLFQCESTCISNIQGIKEL